MNCTRNSCPCLTGFISRQFFARPACRQVISGLGLATDGLGAGGWVRGGLGSAIGAAAPVCINLGFWGIGGVGRDGGGGVGGATIETEFGGIFIFGGRGGLAGLNPADNSCPLGREDFGGAGGLAGSLTPAPRLLGV